MKSLAICDRRYAKRASEVVGGDLVLACPPSISDTELDLAWRVSDFIYIDLHGRPDQPQYLFADFGKGRMGVLHVNQLKDLPPRVVFITACYLPGTAFLDALREGYVVYGGGKNYGARYRATGAPLLALWFRRFLERGVKPEKALKLAKARLVLSSWRQGDRDAMKFRIALPGAA